MIVSAKNYTNVCSENSWKFKWKTVRLFGGGTTLHDSRDCATENAYMSRAYCLQLTNNQQQHQQLENSCKTQSIQNCRWKMHPAARKEGRSREKKKDGGSPRLQYGRRQGSNGPCGWGYRVPSKIARGNAGIAVVQLPWKSWLVHGYLPTRRACGVWHSCGFIYYSLPAFTGLNFEAILSFQMQKARRLSSHV